MFEFADFRQFCVRFCHSLLSMTMFSLLVLYLIAGSTWLEIITTMFVATMMLGLAGMMRLHAAIREERKAALQPIPVIAGFNRTADDDVLADDIEIVDDFWTLETETRR